MGQNYVLCCICHTLCYHVLILKEQSLLLVRERLKILSFFMVREELSSCFGTARFHCYGITIARVSRVTHALYASSVIWCFNLYSNSTNVCKNKGHQTNLLSAYPTLSHTNQFQPVVSLYSQAHVLCFCILLFSFAWWLLRYNRKTAKFHDLKFSFIDSNAQGNGT